MHVVVTGGSSGIGLAVARSYAAAGASVSLIARNADRLEAALRELDPAGRGHVTTAPADVADGEALEMAIRRCEALFGPCDILIAAAGIVTPALFHEQDAPAFRSQWETNFCGVTNAVRCVYPAMRLRGEGRIMIVSSATAFIGIPGYSAYCASKSALAGFADALRLEAMPAGVTVGLCFPPDTQTPQLEQEMLVRPPEAARLIGRVRSRSADWVARRIMTGVEKKRGRVHFTPGIAALSAFSEVVRLWVAFWSKRRA